MNAVLLGTGRYLPARIVENVEFTRTLDTTDEWIRTRTGIRERRYAAPEETTSSMGILASRSALADAKMSPDDLDLIICATVTPDVMTPSTANLIHQGLGCRPILSFDITAACTGFLYGLSVADQYIRTGTAKNVLVVGSDTLSRIIDFSDRNTCILFGDGAGAAVLSASDESRGGLHTVKLLSDGSGASLISVPSLTSSQLPGETANRYLRMNGREVFRFAVSRMIEMIEQALIDAERLGLQIDLLVPHQVNQRIIDSALESSGFPKEKVMVNLDRYGNTSGASVPIALDEALKAGRAKAGDTILFVAFGGGLTWGSAMITL